MALSTTVSWAFEGSGQFARGNKGEAVAVETASAARRLL